MGIFEGLGKAEGLIHLASQSCLIFGRNRKEPVLSRPVVMVRRHNRFVIVLPCTTQPPKHSDSPKFFELTPEQVMWVWKNPKRSFAYYRYERISSDCLGAKVGILSQNARVELWKWLQERWIGR